VPSWAVVELSRPDAAMRIVDESYEGRTLLSRD
jgi:hypothetical protein